MSAPFSWFDARPGGGYRMTLTWSLEPDGQGTRVTIAATDVPDGISSEDHATALASTLRNLKQYLARRGEGFFQHVE